MVDLSIVSCNFQAGHGWPMGPGRSVMAMRFMNGLTGIINTLTTPHALKVMVETLGFQHLDLDPWTRSGSFQHAGKVQFCFSWI
jgi:hypothetical protein